MAIDSEAANIAKETWAMVRNPETKAIKQLAVMGYSESIHEMDVVASPRKLWAESGTDESFENWTKRNWRKVFVCKSFHPVYAAFQRLRAAAQAEVKESGDEMFTGLVTGDRREGQNRYTACFSESHAATIIALATECGASKKVIAAMRGKLGMSEEE